MAPPEENRRSSRKRAEVKSDPYDITQDAEILEESVREQVSIQASERKKKDKAMMKARESFIVHMNNSKEAKEEAPVVKIDNEEFQCATCPRSFKSVIGRQRHLVKCTSTFTKEGTCPCCSLDLGKAHTVGELKCPQCNGLFENEISLTRHVEIIHRGSEIFCCAVCPALFFEKKNIISHLATHSDKKPWMCKKCNAVFTRKYQLNRHFRQSGCDGLLHEKNVCQVCGRKFTRKDNLREHLRAHAGINKRLTVYTCEYCNEAIAGLNNYNNHKRIKHVGDRPYKCSYCPMTFPTSGAMKKHQRRHTGEKPYECHLCFKKFAAKETLNRHMRIHTQEKPYSCPHCDKSFIQNAQLRYHLVQHTGEQLFSCNRCDASFPRKPSLLNHILFIHEKADPMLCDICQKEFYIKGELERHVLNHLKVNAYQCEVCQKTFSQKAYLRIHALTHTKEPPRACNYCNRAFIRQDCLLRHMRAKHRDKIERILMEAERKKLQLQLLSLTKGSPMADNSAPADDLSDALPASISELLTILVDEETLKSFGAPHAPVDAVLKMVIKRCGHNPVDETDLGYYDGLRENAKLLFTVVIDDAGVKDLLNNQSVDVVIQHVLNLVKS